MKNNKGLESKYFYEQNMNITCGGPKHRPIRTETTKEMNNGGRIICQLLRIKDVAKNVRTIGFLNNLRNNNHLEL